MAHIPAINVRLPVDAPPATGEFLRQFVTEVNHTISLIEIAFAHIEAEKADALFEWFWA